MSRLRRYGRRQAANAEEVVTTAADYQGTNMLHDARWNKVVDDHCESCAIYHHQPVFLGRAFACCLDLLSLLLDAGKLIFR
jgi:hypothetical protein